jgi:hypothetical protein
MPTQEPPPEELLDELELLELDELDDELELLDDDELEELDELLLDDELEELLDEELPSHVPSEVHSSPEPAGPLLVAGLLFCVL